MKYVLMAITLFLSCNCLFAQVQHKDSLVIENEKTYNYNIFRFGRTKVELKLDKNSSFKKDPDRDYVFEYSPEKDVLIQVFTIPNFSGYYSLAQVEESGKRLENSLKKKPGFMGINSLLVKIKNFDALYTQILNKDKKYTLTAQYTFNLFNQQFFILYLAKADTEENIKHIAKDYIPTFQSMVKENVNIYENYY